MFRTKILNSLVKVTCLAQNFEQSHLRLMLRPKILNSLVKVSCLGPNFWVSSKSHVYLATMVSIKQITRHGIGINLVAGNCKGQEKQKHPFLPINQRETGKVLLIMPFTNEREGSAPLLMCRCLPMATAHGAQETKTTLCCCSYSYPLLCAKCHMGGLESRL